MGKSVLFIVCSCLLFFKGQSGNPCPVVMTPSQVLVPYGGSIKVNCSSTVGHQTDGMGWESTIGGVPLQQKAVHVLLNIDKVDAWDIESTCYINLLNSNPSQCLEPLPLIVYKMPDNVSIVSETKVMEEHKEYEMQCAVSNIAPMDKVIVTWYKGDRSIKQVNLSFASGPPPYNQSQSSVIRITADKDYHGNKLTCEVAFDFGPTWPKLPPVRSPSLDLQVHYKPIFEEPKETVMVPVSGKITLNCTAQGNPKPNYHWQVHTGEKMMSLPVLDLQMAFPGTYNCTASNSQGSTVKQFLVIDAPRDYTVLAAVVAVPAALGVLLLVSGPFIVTKDGTFSLNKGGYSSGQPI